MLSEVLVPLSPEDVRALVAAFDGADWDEMTLTVDGTRLVLSRSGRPPSPLTAPALRRRRAAAGRRRACRRGAGRRRPGAPSAAAQPGPPGAAAAHATAATAAGAVAPAAADGAGSAVRPGRRTAGHRVVAPSVGLFWRSPKPGAPPFVEVGDEVRPDDTVCIVEVMKLMNHVRAGVAGTVRAVHPENGQMVEHGDPLFTIEPAG